jgi:hypothetical protein
VVGVAIVNETGLRGIQLEGLLFLSENLGFYALEISPVVYRAVIV